MKKESNTVESEKKAYVKWKGDLVANEKHKNQMEETDGMANEGNKIDKCVNVEKSITGGQRRMTKKFNGQ